MSVTIEGSGFQAGATVKFGGVAATTTFVDSTKLTAVPPAHAAGSVDVEVDNPGGVPVVLQGGYTYDGDLLDVDFTALPLGACATLPGGLTFTRASDATVQVGAHARLDSVGGNDIAAIGQRTDLQDDRGLVIEPATTNIAYPSTPPTTSTGTWGFVPGGGTVTAGQVDPANGTNATRLQLPDAQYCWQLLAASNPTLCMWSLWAQNRNNAGGLTIYQGDGTTAGWQVGAPNYTADWQRISKYLAPADSLFFDTRGYATPYYAPIDGNFCGVQVENRKYTTELVITTTAAATCAGKHVERSVAGVVDGNRLSFEFRFTSKAAIGDADGVGYFWRIDANNYASLDPSTRKFTASIGGTAFTWTIPLSWKLFDKVSLYVAAGNGAPRLAYRVARLGVAVDLGTGTTMGNAPSTGTVSLMCDGTTGQVASWWHRLKAKASGTLPSWLTGPQPPQTEQVTCVGDSISVGYGLASPATQNYPAQLTGIAGAEFGQPINLGITGDTVANMNGSTRRAQVLATYDAFKRNIVFVWAGTNDFAGTTNSVASTLASLWALCDFLRASGFYVIVVTCLPRDSITQPQATFDSNRAAYNTGMRTDWPSHADDIADVASDSIMGPDLAQGNATYFLGDRTHPTKAGYTRLVTNYIAPALARAA